MPDIQKISIPQGWDIFYNTKTKKWQVQKIDEAEILDSDDEAIVLARAAGIDCDNEGFIK